MQTTLKSIADGLSEIIGCTSDKNVLYVAYALQDEIAALASPVSAGIAGDERAILSEAAKLLDESGFPKQSRDVAAITYRIHALVSAVPAQPTQPQQVEGVAPTHQAESIPPFAEPAGQRNAPYQVTIGGNGLFAGLKVNVDPSLPLDTIELRGANRVRLNLKTGQQTILPAETAGCSPAESVESTLSPEPAKVGGAGALSDEQIEAIAHRKCTSYEHVPKDLKIKYQFAAHHMIDFARALLTAKASGVQAADLAKLRWYTGRELQGAVDFDMSKLVLLSDVEALFNPAPTGETKP